MNEEDLNSLIQATKKGDLDKIKEYTKGRDINKARTNNGAIPLDIATENGHQFVEEYLKRLKRCEWTHYNLNRITL